MTLDLDAPPSSAPTASAASLLVRPRRLRRTPALRDLHGRDLVLMTDVCLCEYTSHGHCGVLDGDHVDNDATLELLARTARSHVEAGADVVAPSDMMDGRVAAIREELPETPIVAYSA